MTTSEIQSTETLDPEWQDPLRLIKSEVLKALGPIKTNPDVRRLYSGGVRGVLTTQLIGVAGVMDASKERLPWWRLVQRHRANTAIRVAEKALSQIVVATDEEVARFIVYGVGVDAVNVGGRTATQLIAGLNGVVGVPGKEIATEMPSEMGSESALAQPNHEPRPISPQ